MEIKYGSTWEVTGNLRLTIGSDTRNPNGTSRITLNIGEKIVWDDDAPNGNVWFYFNYNGKKERGKVESGSIINLISSNKIKLIDNGNGFIAYNSDYVKRRLN
jgi:hypothetical protein